MILTPGKKYSIKVKVDGKEMYHDELDAQDLNQFMRLEHDYHVYSDDFEGEKVQMKLALQEKFTKVLTETGEIKVDTTLVFGATTIITDKDTLVMSDLNDIVKKNKQEFYKEHKNLAEQDHVTEEQLVEGHVDEDEGHHDGKGYEPSVFHPVFSAADTVYRIQVAAYRKPENYSWKGEDHYGDVLEVTYKDGITRFTIGGTKYLSEAESLRKKLMEFGVEDAFIVAFKGKERIPLYELIKLQKQ